MPTRRPWLLPSEWTTAPCPRPTGAVRRPARRAVVDHENVGLRDLLAQRVQHGGEVVLLVPSRDEDEGVAHTRSSSSRAPRICRAATVSAASSQTSAPGVGATRAT